MRQLKTARLKTAASKIAGAAQRPGEILHLIREGVGELHHALEKLTKLVGDLDSYLARYEQPPSTARPPAAPRRATRGPAKRGRRTAS